MILSGSWRRIERRPRAKVNPFFSLTGICTTPASWYSTGSSIVMTLLSSVLISLIAAYSEVVLPLPVGPVTSTMPYGSVMARRNRRRSSTWKPKRSSRSAATPAAMYSLSRIRITTTSPNALGRIETRKSTAFRAQRHRNPPVGGPQPFGDVQLRHHLDPRDQRGVELEVQRIERRRKDPVNPILDVHRPISSLHVNIARPPLQGVQHNRVHELDHRALVLGDLLDGQHFVAPFVLPEQDRPIVCLNILQRLARPFAPGQDRQNRVLGADHQPEGALQQQLQFVQGRQIAGIVDGNDKQAILLGERHKRMAIHQFNGDGLIEPGVHPVLGQGLIGQAVLGRQRPAQLLCGEETLRHQRLPERPASVLQLAEDRVKLRPRDYALLNQHLTEGFTLHETSCVISHGQCSSTQQKGKKTIKFSRTTRNQPTMAVQRRC